MIAKYFITTNFFFYWLFCGLGKYDKEKEIIMTVPTTKLIKNDFEMYTRKAKYYAWW